MLTKAQKTEHVALAGDKIKNSKTVLFADFTGVSNKDLETFKRELREKGASVKVFKKSLLAIALKEAGIDYDPVHTTDSPLLSIFSENEISELAGPVFKFGTALKKANDASNLEVLSAYDGTQQKVLSKEEFVMIAKLPSKDVLLAMIMGGITGPLRAFMSIVKQLSEKNEGAPAKTKEEIASEPDAPRNDSVEEEAKPEEDKQEVEPASS